MLLRADGRCPGCSARVRSSWVVCPECGLSLSAALTQTVPGGTPWPVAPEEGRFSAGTVLADRYRILGLIGRGGMGEVYRAYDLFLKQTVALKFLPAASQSDPAALARFRSEVRIARQVSHPNVCRVYDIGVAENFYFLSMEYVDGEDLASLLRRIGRLPEDKAIEFTRRVCAGLAAAHDRDVLHRDLKPANIMIDGRGQVRITDFGLAVLNAELRPRDVRSGTPAYMAPEQRAGREVTRQSDLYSLGLVLFEMFTGKPRTTPDTRPSDLVKDLSPQIERIILTCLNEDPSHRPSSAVAVSMALPGGDPIAVALAAGDTPSPEMVAASQKREGLRPHTAVLFFAGILFLLAVTSVLKGRTTLLGQAPIEIPPEGLAFRAQEILRDLGYNEKPVDTAHGFYLADLAYIRSVLVNEPWNRNKRLASLQPAMVRFWYRQSTASLEATSFLVSTSFLNGVIEPFSPRNDVSGMALVMLDGKGRLVWLDVRPSESNATEAGKGPDWNHLLLLAGLEPELLTAVAPGRIPSMAFDTRAEWTGKFAKDRLEQIRVDAASWQGRPVSFHIRGDWQTPANVSKPSSELAAEVVLILALLSALLGTALIAIRNIRAGRSDNRAAAKTAIAIFLLEMSKWILTAAHVPSDWEIYLLLLALSWASFVAVVLWLAYLAIEPYVRRHWPDALISWSRLQAGHMRDSLVASHILGGMASGVAGAAGGYLLWTVGDRWARPWMPRLEPEMHSLADMGTLAAYLASAFERAAIFSIFFTVILILLRLLLRRTWLANCVMAVVFATGATSIATNRLEYAALWAFGIAGAFLVLFTLQYFGFLGIYSGAVMRDMLLPLQVTVTSWYGRRAILVLVTITLVAVCALSIVLTDSRRKSTA